MGDVLLKVQKGEKKMYSISDLRIISMKLYNMYRFDLLSLEEYLEQIRPLDQAIDQMELNALNCYLLDTPAFERPSLKHLPS